MTKDNVNVNIESVIYWHIDDPYEAHFGVNDVRYALIERARTSLRDICGSHFLQELIENRDAISAEIQEIIDPAARQWGVKVRKKKAKGKTEMERLIYILISFFFSLYRLD